MRHRDFQRGFTLIELAIAITIISLLLVGILVAGPAMIDSARQKEAVQRILKLRVAVQSFRDTRRMLPGDYPASTTDMAGLSDACAVDKSGAGKGDGNGLISSAESACVGEHLFRNGLLESAVIPTAYGPTLIVSRASGEAAFNIAKSAAPVASLPTAVSNVIVVQDIPCSIAAAVDRLLDDGNLATGRNVVSLDGSCSGSTPIWMSVSL